MCRHFLRVLERTVVGEVGGDLRCPTLWLRTWRMSVAAANRRIIA
jgi:hypothetical protein